MWRVMSWGFFFFFLFSIVRLVAWIDLLRGFYTCVDDGRNGVDLGDLCTYCIRGS